MTSTMVLVSGQYSDTSGRRAGSYGPANMQLDQTHPVITLNELSLILAQESTRPFSSGGATPARERWTATLALIVGENS